MFKIIAFLFSLLATMAIGQDDLPTCEQCVYFMQGMANAISSEQMILGGEAILLEEGCPQTEDPLGCAEKVTHWFPLWTAAIYQHEDFGDIMCAEFGICEGNQTLVKRLRHEDDCLNCKQGVHEFVDYFFDVQAIMDYLNSEAFCTQPDYVNDGTSEACMAFVNQFAPIGMPILAWAVKGDSNELCNQLFPELCEEVSCGDCDTLAQGVADFADTDGEILFSMGELIEQGCSQDPDPANCTLAVEVWYPMVAHAMFRHGYFGVWLCTNVGYCKDQSKLAKLVKQDEDDCTRCMDNVGHVGDAFFGLLGHEVWDYLTSEEFCLQADFVDQGIADACVQFVNPFAEFGFPILNHGLHHAAGKYCNHIYPGVCPHPGM